METQDDQAATGQQPGQARGCVAGQPRKGRRSTASVLIRSSRTCLLHSRQGSSEASACRYQCRRRGKPQSRLSRRASREAGISASRCSGLFDPTAGARSTSFPQEITAGAPQPDFQRLLCCDKAQGAGWSQWLRTHAGGFDAKTSATVWKSGFATMAAAFHPR